jgi:phosphoribosylglycinamide formyltransferase-1
MSNALIRVALFASGTGSNALALLARAKKLRHVKITALVIDQKGSPLLEKIPTMHPELTVLFIPAPNEKEVMLRRKLHETQIIEQLAPLHIDWCFLAGYMRVLGPTLLSAFQKQGQSRIVNIHPSLLPLYPGLHAYEKCYEAGDARGGCTVHLVNDELDGGPILVQESFERLKNDTINDFITRGKALEWKVYGDVLERLDREGGLKPREIK